MRTVVLLSGGLDSTVCLWWAKANRESIRALSIDYGQRHRRELDAAKRIASLAGVEHRPLKASVPWPPMAGDVLPGRNTILLGIAAAHAAAWAGGEPCEVVIGCCGADAEAFPDCRAPYLLAAGKALSLGLGVEVSVVAPLVVSTKAQTIAMGIGLGAPIAETWTCYAGGAAPCGACSSCRSRAAGFAELGEADPWHA